MKTSTWKVKRLIAAGIWVSAMLTLGGAARAEEGGPIHPDCKANREPELCTEIVNEILTELGNFNTAFNPPNVAEAAAYYHPNAVLYTGATGMFYVGRDSIAKNYFTPVFAAISGGSVDFHKFHFMVISPSVVITYGALPATIVLKNGMTVTQPPLPQSLTWVRNESFDRKRPFLIVSDHE